jgi:hypothetical protein
MPAPDVVARQAGEPPWGGIRKRCVDPLNVGAILAAHAVRRPRHVWGDRPLQKRNVQITRPKVLRTFVARQTSAVRTLLDGDADACPPTRRRSAPGLLSTTNMLLVPRRTCFRSQVQTGVAPCARLRHEHASRGAQAVRRLVKPLTPKSKMLWALPGCCASVRPRLFAGRRWRAAAARELLCAPRSWDNRPLTNPSHMYTRSRETREPRSRGAPPPRVVGSTKMCAK